MKDMNGTKIIGVDHGYGNIKTANCCFPTGIAGYDDESLFTADMLVFEDRYYLIGEVHLPLFCAAIYSPNAYIC